MARIQSLWVINKDLNPELPYLGCTNVTKSLRAWLSLLVGTSQDDPQRSGETVDWTCPAHSESPKSVGKG